MKIASGAMFGFCAAVIVVSGACLYAADQAEKKTEKSDATIAVGEGKLVLTAPEKWSRVKPKYNMIEHEFAVPAVEPDTQPGRLMVMGAGGSIDDNIKRWVGQFEPAAGEPKIEKKSIAGQLVHLVDISGNFKDSPGPNSGIAATERPDYRMLAAIIESKAGNYFVKLYGPKKTMAAAEADFHKMIDGLQAK